MANFIDLRNRLVDLFGEDQRAEIFERLNLARTEGHLPPTRSRGDRKRADLTSLDCAVAILALVSSDRGYEAGKQLEELRALTVTVDEPVRLDETLASIIDDRRKKWPDTSADQDKNLHITVMVSPLPLGAHFEIYGPGPEGEDWHTVTQAVFGEPLSTDKPLLGAARIISGEIIGAVADLLGPVEEVA